MNKLVVDLLQQKGLGCWKVLKKRWKQKGKVFPQLTNLMVHEGHQTSWAILKLRWEDKLLLYAKSDQMFMRTVQQIVFLILNSVPVTSVTDPELIGLLLLSWRIFWTRKLWPERRRHESARLRLLGMSKQSASISSGMWVECPQVPTTGLQVKPSVKTCDC